MCQWQEKLAGLRGSRLIVRGTRSKRSYYQQHRMISSNTQKQIQLQASLALVKETHRINRLTATNFLANITRRYTLSAVQGLQAHSAIQQVFV
jgi:hypothetical protein